MKLIALVLALAATTMAACGSKEQSKDDGKVGSCMSDEAKGCREYHDDNFALGEKSLRELCALDKSAKFTMTACPTASIIGRCTRREGTDLYYTGAPGMSSAEKYCTDSHGTYSAK